MIKQKKEDIFSFYFGEVSFLKSRMGHLFSIR